MRKDVGAASLHCSMRGGFARCDVRHSFRSSFGACAARARNPYSRSWLWIPGSPYGRPGMTSGESHGPSPIYYSNSRHTLAFPRRISRPSYPSSSPSEIERAQGMPGEGLTHGPPAEKNAGGRYHRCCRSSGIPCAVDLRLYVLSPGTGLFAPVTCVLNEEHREAWHQHRDARTTRLHVRMLLFVGAIRSRCNAMRPPHPRPAYRDDRAYAPLVEAGCRHHP